MAGVDISLAIGTLQQPFKEALHTAASMRVTGIEIDARNDLKPSDISATGIRQLRKLLNDLNLSITSIRFPTRRGYDNEEELDRRVTATKQAMRMATELGCRVLVNSIGKVAEPAAEPDESQILLRDVMSDLASYSTHYGCFMACETGSESISTLAKFLEGLPEHAVHMALNPANLIAEGFELDDLGSAASWVSVVYASDTVPDRSRSGKAMNVPLGQGLVDFPQMIATLEDARFRGPYVVRGSKSNPTGSALQAVEFLRSL